MTPPTVARDAVPPPAGQSAPTAPAVVRPSAGIPVSAGGPDAPVRFEVAMPRHLFDRLTDHDEAPRCRYDEHTGLAEFVAEPGVAHEEPAVAVSQFFSRFEDALADRSVVASWRFTGALRLLSDDGAFEADASFYLDAAARAVGQVEGYLDVRTGLPPPSLVVEIDRSRRSRHKLRPYFRMGVEEVWTNHRLDRAVIWRPDAGTGSVCRPAEESGVCPGLTRADLDRLFSRGDPPAPSGVLARPRPPGCGTAEDRPPALILRFPARCRPLVRFDDRLVAALAVDRAALVIPPRRRPLARFDRHARPPAAARHTPPHAGRYRATLAHDLCKRCRRRSSRGRRLGRRVAAQITAACRR